MRLRDFDFELPPGQIAQAPLPERDASRLMTLDRKAGVVGHRRFDELPELLRPGDLLVLNDARVTPARLLGRKARTGGQVELLVVRPVAPRPAGEALSEGAGAFEWICLGQASKGLKPGAELEMTAGLSATVQEALGGGEYRVRFQAEGDVSLAALLERAGRVPLPPYISREPTTEDAHRYQTVYARSPGSVAAPTAGLHFTPALLARLEKVGVSRASITLDVGPGTFLPVREEEVERHRMHPERFHVPEETARAVDETRARGGRVIAVGTTVVRALESAAEPASGRLRPGPGETTLFIRPGFTFRGVDALLTNFHLPRSTLLMLVCAFAGRAQVLAAYGEAVRGGYRFFSYGDAMLIGG